MKSENYIVINGKRAELTEEQLKQLGIVLEKETPFDRVGCDEEYYYIATDGRVCRDSDINAGADASRYNAANYCTDKDLMYQRALHETLNRLLWRYSMIHKSEKETKERWYMYYKSITNHWIFDCYYDDDAYIGDITFDTKEVVQSAIEEIIKPFMAAHPDFEP